MNFELDKLVDCIESQTEPETFSGVVSVSNGGEVLFEQGFGLANRSAAIENTADTRLQMASGSKIFTALAICQLVDQERLSFDTLLSECVSESFPNYAPEITLHHLLTHTSGITSYFEEDIDPDYEALWQKRPMYLVREPSDFLPMFQNKPMKFPPGQKFDYNDAGYILLGLVIESVIGKGFASHITESVFAAAGMNSSGYFPADQLPDRTAFAYIKNDSNSWRTNFFAVPIVGGPDGGAYTTAQDMTAFWRAMSENKLLSASATANMLNSKVVTSLKPPYSHYGYGVWIEARGGEVRKRFVEGFDPGVALRSSVYPDRDLILTVMGNTSAALWPLYERIEKVLAL